MNLIKKLKTNKVIEQNDITSIKPPITLELIRLLCCLETKINQDAFLGKSRKREIVQARQLYYFFAKNRTNYTLAQIKAITNQHHATVMHGVNTINDLKQNNSMIRNFVNNINSKL